MGNKLEIKYRNQKQSFEILENEILVDLFTAKHKLKYNIPLDEIRKTHFISKSRQDTFSIIAYSSLITNFIFLVYFAATSLNFSKPLVSSILITVLFASIFLLKSFFESVTEKHLDASKLFYFIYTKKNAAEVDHFIELIYTKQTEFFRKKYFLIDPALPYNLQHERFIWLYTNHYINENEYEVIKDDLDDFSNFNPNLSI